MKRLAAVGVVLAIVVVAVGSAVVMPLLKRKVQGATGAIAGWEMSDDLVGAPQFDERGKALLITRFHRGTDTYFRIGALDLGSGALLAHQVLDDRGVQYYGQGDGVAWMRGTSADLHARDPGGAVLIDEQALRKKNPQLPGGLLHQLDDGAFVDAHTGGLFLPGSDKGGPAFLIDPVSFTARPATEAEVKRQPVSGAVPVARLSTGEMLTTSRTAGGSWLAVGGKQVVKDQRMYSLKYLTSTRTGALLELDAPRSIVVLYNEWDNANPRVLVSRVALDGRVLWTTPVRNARTLRREQLKVVSSGLHGGRLVLVIDDHYKATYQPPVFTPLYALALDLESGRIAWNTPL